MTKGRITEITQIILLRKTENQDVELGLMQFYRDGECGIACPERQEPALLASCCWSFLWIVYSLNMWAVTIQWLISISETFPLCTCKFLIYGYILFKPATSTSFNSKPAAESVADSTAGCSSVNTSFDLYLTTKPHHNWVCAAAKLLAGIKHHYPFRDLSLKPIITDRMTPLP